MKKVLLLSLLCTSLQATDCEVESVGGMSTGSGASTRTDMSIEAPDGVCPVCKEHSALQSRSAHNTMRIHALSDDCLNAKLTVAVSWWPSSNKESDEAVDLEYDSLPDRTKREIDAALRLVQDATLITDAAGTSDPTGCAHLILGTFKQNIGLFEEARKAFQVARDRGNEMGLYHQVLVDMMCIGFDIDAAIKELVAAQERLNGRIDLVRDGEHVFEVLTADRAMITELVGDLEEERAKIARGEYRDKKQDDGIPEIDCAHCKTMLFVRDYDSGDVESTTTWQTWVCHAWSSHCVTGKIMLAQKLLSKHGIMQWLLSNDDVNRIGFGDDIDNDLGCLARIIKFLKDQGHSYGWALTGILDYMALRAEVVPSDAYAVFDPKLLKQPFEQFEQAEERGNLFAAFWRLKMMWEFNRPNFEEENGRARLAELNSHGVYEAGDLLASITPDAPAPEVVKAPWWKTVTTSLLRKLRRKKEGEVS